jgi:uncharacterized membrane protein YfcA
VSLLFLVVLAALGFAGAFVAGMLGIGGAIVMLPLLLYTPPLLGFDALDVKTVAGITMTQVLFGSLSGLLTHRRHHAVSFELALATGPAMAAGSLLGGLASGWMRGHAVLTVYALMVTGGALLMLLPSQAVDPEILGGARRFNRVVAGAGGGGIGLVAGVVGAGGAFLILPLLVVALRTPLRVAIGTSMAIAAMGAVSGFLGKLVTGQIVASVTLPVLAGAILAAPLGASTSHRVSVRALRATLFAVLLSAAAGVWYDLLVH